MQGADVLQVQRRLTELGYLDGEADGVYGRLTIDAVAQFQRDSGLEKVDGKTGEETLERLFGAELMPRPTPTPTPTARPTATPAPTPTPTPMPRATAVPSAEGAPFDVVQKDIYIGETKTALMLGKADGQTIYPLCGIQMHRGYTCTASGGVWEMAAPSGGTVTLIAGEEDGRLDGAMGAVDDTLLLCDAPVYVYGSEVWVPAAVLSQIGLHIVELEEASVIW
ncbi:MAG: peptidoglycan-binding protein [Clostridia bacterium]|nr:peptidoglycan-binding protein [Clostridia bacterium]